MSPFTLGLFSLYIYCRCTEAEDTDVGQQAPGQPATMSKDTTYHHQITKQSSSSCSFQPFTQPGLIV